MRNEMSWAALAWQLKFTFQLVPPPRSSGSRHITRSLALGSPRSTQFNVSIFELSYLESCVVWQIAMYYLMLNGILWNIYELDSLTVDARWLPKYTVWLAGRAHHTRTNTSQHLSWSCQTHSRIIRRTYYIHLRDTTPHSTGECQPTFDVEYK